MSKKLVVVFGATGNQGGSIVSLWAKTPELKEKYSIRGVTRDTSKPAAKELESLGAEVVAADLNNADSLAHAVKGAYAVFGVTNYWEFTDKAKEVGQGKAMADAAFAAGVKHIVWSSLPHTSKLTNGKLNQIDHFDGKAEVEEYIEQHKSKTGALATHYMPGFFMSNFQNLGIINPGQDGTPTFAAPYGPNVLHGLIDIQKETGAYVWGVIEAGSAADGKQIQAVSDWKTSQEVVDLLTQYGGTKVVFAELPRDVYKGFLVAKMGDYIGEEFTQNMDLISEYSYYGKGAEKNQDASDKFIYKGAQPKTTFKQFVEKSKPWSFG